MGNGINDLSERIKRADGVESAERADREKITITGLCTDVISIIGTHLTVKDIKNARLAHACFNALTYRTTSISLFVSWSKLAMVARKIMLGFGGVFPNLQTVRLLIEDPAIHGLEGLIAVFKKYRYDIEIISEHPPIVNEKYIPIFSSIGDRVTRIDIMGNPLIPNYLLNILMNDFPRAAISIRVIANGSQIVPPPVYTPKNFTYKLEINENDVVVCSPNVYTAVSFGKNVSVARWYTKDAMQKMQRLSLWVGSRSTHLLDILSRTSDNVDIVLYELDFLNGLEVLFWFIEHGRKNKLIIRNITSDMYAQARILVKVSPYKNVILHNVDGLINTPLQDTFAFIRRDVRRKIQAIYYIFQKSKSGGGFNERPAEQAH